jgi:hypothetical protein
MWSREDWRRVNEHPLLEWTVFVVGVLLLLVAPVVGALPGPGGVFVFALGLAMVLKTSRWARRHYVKFKRWQPKAGRWTDWGLRRKSAARREALRKQRQELDGAPAPGVPAAGDDPAPPVPHEFAPPSRSD